MRYFASISYDGSKFYGFQKLKDHKTVQEDLEKCLTKINKKIVAVKGAGRTDRGVHAFDQAIHFDLDISISPDGLKRALNSLVDPAIYVNYCEIINDDFHVRFNVHRKIYQYVINLGEYDPLDNDYIYNYNHQLNIKLMKQAAKYLIGFNSYKAYVSGARDDCNSVIYSIKFKRKKDILLITFDGKSFYNHMVRNLVGALILVGENKIKPECLKEMMMKESNIYNYNTVPSCGLYLVKVLY